MKRILVTGASGYIGRHLIAGLRADGVSVRGLARRPDPIELVGVEWQQGDVRSSKEVTLAAQTCDAVIHLACLPLGASWQDPQADFEVNALGTLNVLKAAHDAGVRRVVYLSTSQVYGYSEHLPNAEDDPPHPVSPYAASKLCGEILCGTFARIYELETMVLRVFNVYGLSLTGDPRQSVEEIFMRQVIKGLPPVIKSRPDEGRDFIHVSDVVRAVLLALRSDRNGEIFNIGYGKLTTLVELADLIIELSAKSIRPVMETGSPQTVMRLQADIAKAEKLLGFVAQVSLRDGLSEMIARMTG